MREPLIYMDNHATTPVDPRVLDAMLPYLRDRVGNASSVDHAAGRDTRRAVELARQQLADLLDASPKEIVFTSGATEADNLAIKGVVGVVGVVGMSRGQSGTDGHIITVATEHRAVLDTCRRLEREGLRVTYLPVDRDGLLDLDDLERAFTASTILVSVMAANNETGVLQPLAEIGRMARAHGALFHTDAAQAAGTIPLTVTTVPVDLVSISAHKMYGPQGVGALYVRSRQPTVRLSPLFDGGGHERGFRSGTLNAPGIVGFGEAAEIARREMADEAARLRRLRDRLLAGLQARVPGLHVNGSMTSRLGHNLNVSLEGLDETLAAQLEGLAVSAGSACSTASIEPSHVLQAMGVAPRLAHGTLRFGLGRFNTERDVDAAIDIVASTVARLRAR